jgi:tetratricopeptide (TPR) repeat protein
MKVPFHLRHVPPRPATALLLLTDRAEELLALCARVGGAGFPAVHAVASGFVVRLGQESEGAYPSTIRLRCLAPNLLLPVDAELVPALLPDEAEALVRLRGLVFLPDGKVLSFAPNVLLSAADLLRVPRLPRRAWQPLPLRPQRPDRLHEVLLEAPQGTVEGLLQASGSGIGTEAPRLAEAGPAATAAGHTLAGLGHGLAWLGRHLRLEGLARFGARLVEQAIRQAPRISEAVLGQQEAALRELLRQFREGDLEQALRHALPLGESEGRGSQAAGTAELPVHSPVYSLGALLGAGNGPGSVWLASGDVYDALAAEYRKAAEQATQRGDHRRAAFIYGMLLHDWRQAAAVLARGGLQHDAAVIYLEKVADPQAAAQAFESAGEVDRALELYLARCEHAAAGDLLARTGEPERALEQYELAAYLEAGRGNHQAAGELLLHRAGRPDRAEPHFRAGWRQRPWGTSQSCLLHLLELYARREGSADLLALVDEADAFFAHEGSDQQAAQFYNDLARRASAEHLAAWRDDLGDRAVRGLAGRLRQRAGLGQYGPSVVAGLFLPSGPWGPTLVRDAEVALRHAARGASPARASQARRVRTHNARLTAVCAARQTGQLFLGFEDGAIVRFDLRQGSSRVDVGQTGRIDALSADDEGRLLVAVSRTGTSDYRVSSCRLEDGGKGYGLLSGTTVIAPPFLTPVAASNGRYAVGMWTGESLKYMTGADLMAEASLPAPVELRMALLLSVPSTDRPRLFSLFFEPDSVSFVVTPNPVGPAASEERMRLRLPWGLCETDGALGLPLSWLPLRGRYLEMAGVTATGALGWTILRLFGNDAAVLGKQQTASEPPCRAVTLVRPGVVVGVQAHGVVRYLVDELRLQARPPLAADLADAVACFSSAPTSELLVVGEGGDVVRVPFPVLG